MIKSNFLKSIHTAASFLQNFNDFQAELELWKTGSLLLFQKFTSQSVSSSTWTFEKLKACRFFKNPYHNPFLSSPSVSHPHFLMGCNHLSSTILQNKTIVVQLPMISICSWDFQNHAKNCECPFSLSFFMSCTLNLKWCKTAFCGAIWAHSTLLTRLIFLLACLLFSIILAL